MAGLLNLEPCGHVGRACISLCSQAWEMAGVRGKWLSLLDLIPRLFLLAVDFIAKFVFILHWTACYTLCNLKFLIA